VVIRVQRAGEQPTTTTLDQRVTAVAQGASPVRDAPSG
jgi:hypothetical protein